MVTRFRRCPSFVSSLSEWLRSGFLNAVFTAYSSTPLHFIVKHAASNAK